MEITIGLIGNGSDLTVLPPLEIEYSGTTRTNTYEHKQDKEIFHCPARLPKETLEQLSVAARNAYVSLGAKEFGRVDFIYDPLTKLPYALELNTFAGLQILSSDEVHLHQSYIGKMSTTIGWSSKDLFQRLLMSCLQRINLEAKVEATNS